MSKAIFDKLEIPKPDYFLKPAISFVILTWNSENTIGDCLISISDKCIREGLEYEIFVVDNGSCDRTVEIIRGRFSTLPVDLIRLNSNKGTTFSRNIALKKCRGDIICILDSDTVFKDGRIKEIISLLDDSSIGIVAPRLVLPDGNIQHSVKKFPSVFSKFLRLIGILFKIKIKNYDFYHGFPFSSKKEVDTAISACWFFRRGLRMEVGLLDERIYYSPGDVDYCLRVRKRGKKIIYFPFLTVLHHTQQITHQRPVSRIALSHLWGLTYYFFKHRYIKRPKILLGSDV